MTLACGVKEYLAAEEITYTGPKSVLLWLRDPWMRIRLQGGVHFQSFKLASKIHLNTRTIVCFS